MPTLILTPSYSGDSQALWRTAIQLGWQVERLVHWRLPDELKSVAEPVEQNAAWGAGLYGCDPGRVLEVLRHAVIKSPIQT